MLPYSRLGAIRRDPTFHYDFVTKDYISNLDRVGGIDRVGSIDRLGGIDRVGV